MRIALLCHYPDDEMAPVGGVWAVGRNLAAGMAMAGAEVHVVRYRGGSAQYQSRLGRGSLTVHTVSPAGWLAGLPRQVSCVSALAAALQQIQPDAVTAHAPEYALAALRCGLPTAVTVHGVVRQEFKAFSGWHSRLPLLISIWQDWLVARRAQHIVAISEYVMRQYRHRTRATFHRIDVPVGDVFFAAPSRPPDANTLLLVGGMSERKDPVTLLKALRLLHQRLPDIELRIAGSFRRQGFGARLQRLIQQWGLADHIRWLGLLNQPELARAYAASALTVLSSRQETSPAVLMEAMAARRPVVATAVGGVDEIVADGETGYLVPVGDAQALAEAIERVLRDPAAARAMGQRGRELAEQRYRRAFVGEQYVVLLRRLISSA